MPPAAATKPQIHTATDMAAWTTTGTQTKTKGTTYSGDKVGDSSTLDTESEGTCQTRSCPDDWIEHGRVTPNAKETLEHATPQ